MLAVFKTAKITKLYKSIRPLEKRQRKIQMGVEKSRTSRKLNKVAKRGSNLVFDETRNFTDMTETARIRD